MSIGKELAWVVILTRSNYLAATILLDYSLKKVQSKYKLYVLITRSLPEEAREALKNAGCNMIEIEELRPKIQVSIVAARFTDTWDKLRAFGLEGFEVRITIFSISPGTAFMQVKGEEPPFDVAIRSVREIAKLTCFFFLCDPRFPLSSVYACLMQICSCFRIWMSCWN